MASGDIRNQINGNDTKIAELKKIHDNLNTAIEAVKKEQRKYEYVSSQWAGEKERNLSKEFGSDGTGMHAVRDQIAQSGTTVLTSVNDMITSLQSTNASLEIQYTTAKNAEDAEAARIASEAERERRRQEHMNS